MMLRVSFSTMLFMAFFGFAATGCNSQEKGSGNKELAAKVSKHLTDANKEGVGDSGPVYPAEVAEQKCSFLTPIGVSQVVGVDPSQLSETLSGCLYSWKVDEETEATIYLLSLKVHESVNKAQSLFAVQTRITSEEDHEEAKETLERRMSKRVSKERLEELKETIIDGVDENASTHTQYEGVGDEAAMSSQGTLTVRIRNLTFKIHGKLGENDQLDQAVMLDLARGILSELKRFES